MVMTRSTARPSPASVAAASAPCSWAKRRARSRSTSKMTRSRPARAKLAAIGQPILPMPMKPTLGDSPPAAIALVLAHLLEHFGRRAEGADRARNAAIDDGMHQQLANFLLGHPVGQRAAD